jgi:hypothetical protein
LAHVWLAIFTPETAQMKQPRLNSPRTTSQGNANQQHSDQCNFQHREIIGVDKRAKFAKANLLDRQDRANQ